MQRHGSIVARAALVGLGLSMFLAPGARAQGLAEAAVQSLGQEIKLGEYWIGVQVQHPLPDQVRAQLSIPKDQGILVQEVEPATPAYGKLQQYDVIVKAGAKTLQSVSDLVSAVDAAKGGKLPLEVLRGGKTLRIEVTPVKRPPQGSRDVTAVLEVSPDARFEAVKKALEFLKTYQGPPVRFHTYRPGWMLRPSAPLEAPLPANLSISVTKQGDQPAKIVVQRDDQKWEVTEKELDKLPKDVRLHVERMLGRGPGRVALESLTEPYYTLEFDKAVFGSPGGSKDHKPEAGPPAPPKIVLQPRMERQLEEMRQQLDQLRKSLDELRAEHAAPKAEDKK